MNTFAFFVVFFAYSIIRTVARPAVIDDGCGWLGSCCEAHNNTCFHPKALKIDGEIGRCFCDSNCFRMNDCYSDILSVCQPRDCVVSAWSSWSACSNMCGIGRQYRKRKIESVAAFGGYDCNNYKTRLVRACYSQRGCSQSSFDLNAKARFEVALIISKRQSYYRYDSLYSFDNGIRKNLLHDSLRVYDDAHKGNSSNGYYLATYRVVSATRGCQYERWTRYLKRNTIVCVECQPTAKNMLLNRCVGDGVYDSLTIWKAVETPYCYGKWQLLSKNSSAVCDIDSKTSFAFS